MIDLQHKPAIETVVIAQIRRHADTGALPHRFLDIARIHAAYFVRGENTPGFVIGDYARPSGELVIIAVMRRASTGHAEDVGLAIRQVPAFHQVVELRPDGFELLAAFFLLGVQP